MEDPELLAAYVERGSEEAFTALVGRYSGLVYSAALRQVGGNAHLARDVAQVVFTDLARKAPQLRGHPVLTGWLYTSTRYAAVQLVRSEDRRQRRERAAHSMSELSPPGMPDAWERLRPVLDETMGELEDEERESILLRYFEGRPYAEIGRKLSISENTARMRVDRALDKMHALLSKRGVASTAAALGAVLGGQAIGAVPAGLVSELAGAALAARAPAGGGVVAMLAGKKGAFVVLGGVAILCVGVLTYQLGAIRQSRVEVERQRERTVAAKAAQAREEAGLERRTAEVAARKQFLGLAASFLSNQTVAAEEPERRRLILRTRAAILPDYASLFRILRLSADKRERLEVLVVRKTVNEIVGLHNLTYDQPPGAAAAVDATTSAWVKAAMAQAINDQIEALLGREAFQTYVAYGRTRTIRREIEEIAAAGRFSEKALSDEQVDGLVEFLAQSRGAGAGARAAAGQGTAAGGERLDAVQRGALERLEVLRVARRTIRETNQDAAAHGLVTLLPANGMGLDEL